MSSTSPRTTRNRPASRVVMALMGIGLIVGMAGACTKDQQPLESLFYVNKARESAHLPDLAWNDQLAAKAQAWAERMASTNQLAHSNLVDGVGRGWSYLGENVGCGGGVHDVPEGFMNSKTHRDAILGSEFSSVGIGVAERGGKIWIAQVFEG
jgi:uncharacterized protein YkwD